MLHDSSVLLAIHLGVILSSVSHKGSGGSCSHDPYLSTCQEETLSKPKLGGIRLASALYRRIEITSKVLLMGNLNAIGVYSQKWWF